MSELFLEKEQVLRAAYELDPNSLSKAKLNVVLSLLKKDAVKPEDVCRFFPANNELVLTAYQKDSSVIQYAQLALVEQLVKRGEINAKDAASAFPEHVHFSNVAALKESIANLTPLEATSSFEECSQRIGFLKKLYQEYLLYPVFGVENSLEVLLKQTCLTAYTLAQAHSISVPKKTSYWMSYKSGKLISETEKFLNAVDVVIQEQIKKS